MSRTVEQIFDDHTRALAAADLDAIVANYAEDAVYINPRGVQRGKDGVRAVFAESVKIFSDVVIERTAFINAEDVLYVGWTAKAGDSRLVGSDTFVVADDRITLQTVFYIPLPA